MRNFTTEGIVIKRKNFGEADRSITVFTRKHGKIKIEALGVRRIQSRRGPNIELFNRATFAIRKGRIFDTLSEVTVHETFPRIRKNLELIGLAYHVCELIDGLCAENQPHPPVFDLLVETLSELDRGVIQKFETGLLVELGYLPRNRVFSLNTTSYIEQILERKLKTKRILPRLVS